MYGLSPARPPNSPCVGGGPGYKKQPSAQPSGVPKISAANAQRRRACRRRAPTHRPQRRLPTTHPSARLRRSTCWRSASSSRSQVQTRTASGQHPWPGTDRPWVSAGVHRSPWRLSLTLSLGRSRTSQKRLLPPSLERVMSKLCSFRSDYRKSYEPRAVARSSVISRVRVRDAHTMSNRCVNFSVNATAAQWATEDTTQKSRNKLFRSMIGDINPGEEPTDSVGLKGDQQAVPPPATGTEVVTDRESTTLRARSDCRPSVFQSLRVTVEDRP